MRADVSALTAGFNASERFTLPFTWSKSEHFFDAALIAVLAAEFPSSGFGLAGDVRGLRIRSLVVKNALHPSAASLSASWRKMGKLIASPDYREELGKHVGRDLGDRRIDATFCRHAPRCFIPPHTDRAERDTAHIIYLNRRWPREWGGLFQVLRSADRQDIEIEVSPAANTSVVMLRSEQSWHAVSPIADGIDRERLSLLIFASHGL